MRGGIFFQHDSVDTRVFLFGKVNPIKSCGLKVFSKVSRSQDRFLSNQAEEHGSLLSLGVSSPLILKLPVCKFPADFRLLVGTFFFCLVCYQFYLVFLGFIRF